MERSIIDINTLFGLWPKAKIDCSLDRLLKVLEEKNITKAFTLSARGIFYDFEEGNDETYKACKKYNRLIPVATVIPQKFFGVHEEIIKRWEQGFKVFRFFPEYQEWNIEFLPFIRLFDTFAKTDAIIILPASLGISNICRFTSGLKNPVIISELRFSDLAECLQVLHENRNIYLESRRLISIDAFEVFSSEGLIDRLVIGTYSPICYTSVSITQVEYARISREEKDMIFYKNVNRLLGGVI